MNDLAAHIEVPDRDAVTVFEGRDRAVPVWRDEEVSVATAGAGLPVAGELAVDASVARCDQKQLLAVGGEERLRGGEHDLRHEIVGRPRPAHSIEEAELVRTGDEALAVGRDSAHSHDANVHLRELVPRPRIPPAHVAARRRYGPHDPPETVRV